MKKKCVRCGKATEDLHTRDQFWSIVSESEKLLKVFEKEEDGEDLFDMSDDDHICWSCLCEGIIDVLCDGIDEEEEVEIRKDYKENWGPEYEGVLYRIMNWALEYSCSACGMTPVKIVDYDALNNEGKKRARHVLRSRCVTVKEAERKIRLCAKHYDVLDEVEVTQE